MFVYEVSSNGPRERETQESFTRLDNEHFFSHLAR